MSSSLTRSLSCGPLLQAGPGAPASKGRAAAGGVAGKASRPRARSEPAAATLALTRTAPMPGGPRIRQDDKGCRPETPPFETSESFLDPEVQGIYMDCLDAQEYMKSGEPEKADGFIAGLARDAEVPQDIRSVLQGHRRGQFDEQTWNALESLARWCRDPQGDEPADSEEEQLEHKALPSVKRAYSDHYKPACVTQLPSEARSPELLRSEGSVVVAQSEGATSSTLPLVSRNFYQCSAFIIRNMETGNTLLIHHDSGTRATLKAQDGASLRPASPASLPRGLIGRDRFHYEDFMKESGPKKLLVVDSENGYDRHEVSQQIVARGVDAMPPLTLRLDTFGAAHAKWHLSYRPASDELILHLEEFEESTVMHFPRVFMDTAPCKPTGSDTKDGKRALNIVDDLPVYRQRLATAQLDSDTHEMVGLCLTIAALRNVNQADTERAWDAMVRLPCFPDDFFAGMGKELLHLQGKDGLLIAGLTRLVDRCLSTAGQLPP